MIHQIRIAGSGGQGVVFAANVLGKSAGIYEGRNVIQSQSYGAEARGGRCRSDVIVSDSEIYDIIITKPDVMIIMNQASMDFYSKIAEDCPLLIIDDGLVTIASKTKGRVVKVPAASIAKHLGSPNSQNVVMLGALCAASGFVSVESLEKSISGIFADKVLEANLKALKTGFDAAKAQK